MYVLDEAAGTGPEHWKNLSKGMKTRWDGNGNRMGSYRCNII